MKQVILITLFTNILLFSNPLFLNGEQIFDQSPLAKEFTAIDNGGTMIAIDSYQDAIGTYIVSGENNINNSSMNSLILKYGEEAKLNNKLLIDQIKTIHIPYVVERSLVDIEKNNIQIICNDNNSETEDTMVNNKCVNTKIICNDNNPNTTDSIVNGKCVFAQIICNDNNPNTSDSINNGICIFNPITCDDGNPNTIDSISSGVCIYAPIKCDDNNPDTVNYLKDGICSYVKIDCDDKNPNTIDSLNNGKCSNIFIDCNDNNASTLDQGPVNGICTHTLLCNDNNPNTIDSIENGICVHKNILTTTIYFHDNTRSYNNGTVAASCNEYKYPSNSKYSYKGDIGDGSYLIDPDGSNSNNPRKVFCDMTSDGGGWTLIYSFNNTKEAYIYSDINSINELRYAGWNTTHSYIPSLEPIIANYISLNIPPFSSISTKIPTFGKELKVYLKQSYEISNSLRTNLYIGPNLVFRTDKNNSNIKYIGGYKSGDNLLIDQSFGLNITYLGDIYIK